MRAKSPFATALATVASVLLVGLAPACGDEEPSPEPTTVTLTLLIQSPANDFPEPPPHWGRVDRFPHTRPIDLALRGAPLELEPVAGVRVALDRPDGTRLGEADSDAEGLVVFEVPAADWPENATTSATAYKDGYLMHTLAGIRRPPTADPVPLTMDRWWQDPPPLIQVRGSTNRSRSDTTLWVRSTAPFSSFSEAQSNAWAAQTPPGVAFDLIAIEYNYSFVSNWHYDGRFFQLARISSDAVDEDTILDIDFAAHAVQPTEVWGSFRLPERVGSRLRQPGTFVYVISVTGSSFWSGTNGWITQARNSDSRVDYRVELVDVPSSDGDWYIVFAQANSMAAGIYAGPLSAGYGRGLPDGEQPQLLDLPAWVDETQSPTAGHPIDEPLSWEIFDEAVSQTIWISTGDEVVWIVEVPDGATSVTVPSPPSNAPAELLGDSPRAMVALERQLDSDEGVFWLESWGTELALDLGE